MCMDFFQQNRHTSHQYIHYIYINYQKPSLKTGLQSPDTPRGYKHLLSILATQPFHANYQTVDGTHKSYLESTTSIYPLKEIFT